MTRSPNAPAGRIAGFNQLGRTRPREQKAIETAGQPRADMLETSQQTFIGDDSACLHDIVPQLFFRYGVTVRLLHVIYSPRHASGQSWMTRGAGQVGG
jgi:hypothetical protein